MAITEAAATSGNDVPTIECSAVDMRLVFLLSMLLTLATATSVDIGLPCNAYPAKAGATQELSYAAEVPSSFNFDRMCCALVVTADTEAPLVLLMMIQPSAAACVTALHAVSDPSPLDFWNGQLMFSKAQMCKDPSTRYIMTRNNTEVCQSVSSSEPIVNVTSRLFAFSAASARSLCESSAWRPGASLTFATRPAYVYAPNERLGLLPAVTACNGSEDVTRVVHAENASSLPGLLAEVLYVPDESSCRSLFVQGQLAREGDRFAVAGGSTLTISYNRSQSSSECGAGRIQSIGFIVRVSRNLDASTDFSQTTHVVTSKSSRGWSNDASIILLCASAAVYFSPRLE